MTHCGSVDPKQFGSILNTDNHARFLACSAGQDVTPAEFRKAVGHILRTRPGLFALRVGNSERRRSARLTVTATMGISRRSIPG